MPRVKEPRHTSRHTRSCCPSTHQRAPGSQASGRRRRRTEMTARDIAALVFLAAVAALIFMAGRRLGRWSCRGDYPRGFDCGEQAGIKAERDRGEAAGPTLGEITAWAGARPPEPEEWPEPDATALPGPPSAAVLLAEAGRQGFAGEDSHVRTGASAPGWLGAGPGPGDFSSHPSPAEPGPPVVADITDARAPGLVQPGNAAPAVTGVVVTPARGPDAAADWDVLAGAALPDYAAAALGGHRTVDECVDSIMMRAVGAS